MSRFHASESVAFLFEAALPMRQTRETCMTDKVATLGRLGNTFVISPSRSNYTHIDTGSNTTKTKYGNGAKKEAIVRSN